MRLFKQLAMALAAFAVVPANATTIVDGNFSSTSTTNGGTVPGGVCYSGAPDACVTLAGWTNTDGYTFVSNAATLGKSAFSGGTVTLDAFPSGPAGAPTLGQNYLAVDGVAFGAPRGTISQSLSGLTVGDHYAVTFWQAAAQQSGYTGATTEQWQVTFSGTSGTQTGFSTLMSTPSQGTHAWNQVTLDFTATTAIETLAFYALGTPVGDPPFVLLDDISISDVPEPSTLAAMGAGLVILMVKRRRRRGAAPANTALAS